LNNIGDVNFALGEREKALEYLQQALPLQTAVGDRSGAATSLSNMGSVYSALGDKSAALQCYNQVLALQKAIGDRRGEAMALNMIGNLHSTLGERQEALEYFRRALPIERAVGDRQLEAITLKNINHTSLSSLLANVLTNNIRLLVWILGLVFSLATWIGTRWTRRGSRTWPTTEARIECRSIARDDKGRTWACRLGYSYTVDGQYYSGFAEKTFRSEELASAYRNRVKDGHRVLSRYNPRNPNTSVLDLRILEIGQVPEPRVNTNDGRSRDSRQPIEVLASAAASNPDVSNDIVAISEMSTLSSLEIDSWPNPPDGTEKTRNSLSVVALPKNERR
jgi:tetratricopeptide (TPR) repeat protein